MDYPERGSIYIVNFDPTIGAEIKKKRPALIIQNDHGNELSPLTIVAPITSRENAMYRVEVEIKAPEGGLKHNSIVLLNQIRTVDKRRLMQYLGKLKPTTMHKIDEAIMVSLGVIEL